MFFGRKPGFEMDHHIFFCTSPAGSAGSTVSVNHHSSPTPITLRAKRQGHASLIESLIGILTEHLSYIGSAIVADHHQGLCYSLSKSDDIVSTSILSLHNVMLQEMLNRC